MPITFGTNRFGFPDPRRLIETCRGTEKASSLRAIIDACIPAR